MTQAEKKELKRKLLIQVKLEPELLVDMYIELLERVEKLESASKKNSSNSSKPPSSDKNNSNKPPKPPKGKKKGSKKSGGQKGHQGHTLERVDDPDEIIEHRLERCPHTGNSLSDDDIVSEIRCQVFDIPEPKMVVTEHVYYVYRAAGSSKTCQPAFIPGASAPVQYGKRFGSLLVYLKHFQLIPLHRITQFCSDLFGQKISQGTIDKFEQPCFEHLNRFEEHLKIILASSEKFVGRIWFRQVAHRMK